MHKKLYKIGICGHYGKDKQFLDGQTVKTKMFTYEIESILGANSVLSVDTYGWRKIPFSLFINCFILIMKCRNIVILPSHNGIKIFIPLYVVLNKIFNRRLHYVVIGGWLPKLLVKNNKLKKLLFKFEGIYVETHSMEKELKELGFINVRYLPNFKNIDILQEDTLVYQIAEPYKLCTFSRVLKEKGIEDAIDVVKKVNQALERKVYTLDIYGQIDEKYRNKFEEIQKNLPEYISYKGIVSYDGSIDILKEYFLLLFPTHFKTEGIPGTIIDAYAAGLPVIASNWNSANEVVIENVTGYIYDFMQKSKLEELLFQLHKDPNSINKMRINCLGRAKLYMPNTVMGEFIKYL